MKHNEERHRKLTFKTVFWGYWD